MPTQTPTKLEPIGPTASHADHPGAALFVWSTWALFTLGALGYVRMYGSNLPFWDEWSWIPVATGREPLTWSWLWQPSNDHVLPLSKWAYCVLYRISADVRTGMYINNLGLAALAAGFLRTVRTIRGHYRYTDAFFCILFLHLGHYFHMLFCIHLQYSLSVWSLGAFILAAAHPHGVRSKTGWVLLALSVPCLGLSGGQGWVILPPLTLWLGYCAMSLRREHDPASRRFAIVAGLLAASALFLFILNLVFLPGHLARSAPFYDRIITAIRFLSMSFGSAAVTSWPLSGLAALFLTATTTLGLLWTWRTRKEERIRSSGLLMCLMSNLMLAGAIGWGRAWIGIEEGFALRYTVLACPLLALVYLGWELYGPESPRRFVQMVLFAVLCSTVVFYVYHAREYGTQRRGVADALARDARAGVSPRDLATKYAPDLYRGMEKDLAAGLTALKEAKAEPFANAED